MASSSSSSSGLTKDGFNDYNAGLQAAALKATKHSAGLPSDVAFYRSIDKDFANNLDACSERALSLVNRLLSLASTADSSRSGKGKGKARLEDQDDLVDRFESIIVESMDQLLERADVSLDHFSGRTKAPAIAVKPPPPVPKRTTLAPTPVVQHAAHLPKPQLKFKRKPVNTNGAVWYPQLRHKYNAQVPLGYNFNPNDPESEKAIPPHPYRHEITNITYPSRMFETQSPITPKSFAETPFTWVFTPVDFATMLDKLRNAQEIAVDLEYHSYRTFGGFVCLMQISSREEDWIVDPFELRDEMEDLNEVFTDPKIVKIFHGAESDIAWLQQDFNLYIVNLFDTFHASKVLDFPRHGLASLLEMYCDFTADKRYQLADWRVRPLPQEMLEYARSDTHFLLYIYDNLRNALLDRFLSRSQSRAQSPQSSSTPPPPTTINPSSTVTSLIPPGPDGYVREVLSRSAETSLRVYEREYYDVEGGSGPGGWDTMAKKWNKVALVADGPGGVQREVYRAVHAWRDRTAREEDESTRYVLANHFVFQLAERPPNDMAALLHMFHSVPPVIRRRAKELLDCIRVALKRGLTATTPQTPSPIEPTSAPTTLNTPAGMDVDSTASTAVPSVAPPSSSLWSKPSNPTTQSTSASSLFGSALSSSITSKTPIHPPSATASSYVAPRSSLFGRGASSSAASGSSRAQPPHPKDLTMANVVQIPVVPPPLPSSWTANPPSNKPIAPLVERKLIPAGPAYLAHVRRSVHNLTFEQQDKEIEEENKRLAERNGDGFGEDDLGVGDEEEDFALMSLDPKEWKKQDHYKVLGLSKLRYRANDDQIKIAHRKKVLKHHPDKKAGTAGSTTTNDDAFFKCIQKAMDILTNPEKRRQFDSVDPEFESLKDDVPSASDIKNAKDPKNAFFKEFGPVFEREARFSKKQPVPLLGTYDDTKEAVEGFYDFWYNFDSWRSFEYLDKEVNEGSDNRDDKRYTEKKNKTERARRKKEDTARLRGIVDSALALDPRIKRIKDEEKAAREAKKKSKSGTATPTNAKAQAEEEKRKAEEEAKKKEEEDKVAKAEAKKAKAAAAKAAKLARRAARQEDDGAAS